MDSTHREDWLSHEHTQALRAKAKEMDAGALQRLITACRQSTDPTVRAAIAQYEAGQRMQELLSKGV